MDDEYLKGTGGGNYWKELLDHIRNIRSSEKITLKKCYHPEWIGIDL